jgi:hypothetical protein
MGLNATALTTGLLFLGALILMNLARDFKHALVEQECIYHSRQKQDLGSIDTLMYQSHIIAKYMLEWNYPSWPKTGHRDI